MPDVKITNLIKCYTLMLLYKRPMHGYELIKELETCLSQKISSSHVYPFLKILKRNRLVAMKNYSQRDKKQYALTVDGKRFAKTMIHKLSIIVDVSLGKKVKKCAHCVCKIYEGGYKARINGRTLYFCCVHCAKSFKLQI